MIKSIPGIEKVTYPRSNSMPLYRCEACGDEFEIQVWHCFICGHHWPMAREDCLNCHEEQRRMR